MTKPLSARRARFVEEYLLDLNGTQAAIRAGYSKNGAAQTAGRLLREPEVASAIRDLIAARSERTGITAGQVLDELGRIAFARAGSLVRYRIGPCRYCWGRDHRYHYTRAEWERHAARHEARRSQEIAAGRDDPGPPDPEGGIGFTRRRAPPHHCPECQGEGIGRAVLADTDSLTEAERALFAGAKVTRTGIEVKLHDKVGALHLIGKHLGMFVERFEGAMKHRDVSDEPLSPEDWTSRHAGDE